jgi:hypothetical protein
MLGHRTVESERLKLGIKYAANAAMTCCSDVPGRFDGGVD